MFEDNFLPGGTFYDSMFASLLYYFISLSLIKFVVIIKAKTENILRRILIVIPLKI